MMVNVLSLSAHSLPMFRESQSRNLKRKREKERLDPVLSHNPEPPISKSKIDIILTHCRVEMYARFLYFTYQILVGQFYL